MPQSEKATLRCGEHPKKTSFHDRRREKPTLRDLRNAGATFLNRRREKTEFRSRKVPNRGHFVRSSPYKLLHGPYLSHIFPLKRMRRTFGLVLSRYDQFIIISTAAPSAGTPSRAQTFFTI